MSGSLVCFFFSSRRRHTRLQGDWSSDVCSSDLDLVRERQRQRGAAAESDDVNLGVARFLVVLQSIQCLADPAIDRKSTRLNSSHLVISYAVFCLKKKKKHRKIRVGI